MVKVGITEAGDAGIDLSWSDKISAKEVDGAVLITKDCNNNFIVEALQHKDKIVVHITCTGYGGTILEPNVPDYEYQLSQAKKLVNAGMLITNVVIRIDPIIPTKKGLEAASMVFDKAIEYGFRRFRISLIDMYPHVRERFKDAKLRLPYGDNFEPSDNQIAAVNKWLKKYNDMSPVLFISACAEPKLNCLHEGCISEIDLGVMGINKEGLTAESKQRKNCLCLSCKTELLSNKSRCPHGCLYCYCAMRS